VAIPRFLEAFEAHSYAVDAFGLLSAPALSGWLQEAAGRHAEQLGVGVAVLQAKGLTWVLARQSVEVDRPVALGERAEVATWPSGTDRLSAFRDFEVRVEGQIRVRAVTQWIVLDLATRKPVRPGSVMPADLVEETPHVLRLPTGRPPAPEPAEVDRPFSTRYRDIDRNLHVTNASYVEWACETVPEETWRRTRLRAFEVHFIAECLHGSRIRSLSAPAGDGSFLHSVRREEDGKELARLRTAWVDR
jgi:medium-chain acyl-[acyl-carrier-protein] hydrolase